jgi:hypothetical protein
MVEDWLSTHNGGLGLPLRLIDDDGDVAPLPPLPMVEAKKKKAPVAKKKTPSSPSVAKKAKSSPVSSSSSSVAKKGGSGGGGGGALFNKKVDELSDDEIARIEVRLAEEKEARRQAVAEEAKLKAKRAAKRKAYLAAKKKRDDAEKERQHLQKLVAHASQLEDAKVVVEEEEKQEVDGLTPDAFHALRGIVTSLVLTSAQRLNSVHVFVSGLVNAVLLSGQDVPDVLFTLSSLSGDAPKRLGNTLCLTSIRTILHLPPEPVVIPIAPSPTPTRNVLVAPPPPPPRNKVAPPPPSSSSSSSSKPVISNLVAEHNGVITSSLRVRSPLKPPQLALLVAPPREGFNNDSIEVKMPTEPTENGVHHAGPYFGGATREDLVKTPPPTLPSPAFPPPSPSLRFPQVADVTSSLEFNMALYNPPSSPLVHSPRLAMTPRTPRHVSPLPLPPSSPHLVRQNGFAPPQVHDNDNVEAVDLTLTDDAPPLGNLGQHESHVNIEDDDASPAPLEDATDKKHDAPQQPEETSNEVTPRNLVAPQPLPLPVTLPDTQDPATLFPAPTEESGEDEKKAPTMEELVAEYRALKAKQALVEGENCGEEDDKSFSDENPKDFARLQELEKLVGANPLAADDDDDAPLHLDANPQDADDDDVPLVPASNGVASRTPPPSPRRSSRSNVVASRDTSRASSPAPGAPPPRKVVTRKAQPATSSSSSSSSSRPPSSRPRSRAPPPRSNADSRKRRR